MAGSRVGELNGKWSLLFRAALTALPIIVSGAIMWGAHIDRKLDEVSTALTNVSVWMAATEANRFTQKDWNRERNLLSKQMPPEWVRKELGDIETELKRLQVSIDRLEANATGRTYDGRGYDGD